MQILLLPLAAGTYKFRGRPWSVSIPMEGVWLINATRSNRRRGGSVTGVADCESRAKCQTQGHTYGSANAVVSIQP